MPRPRIPARWLHVVLGPALVMSLPLSVAAQAPSLDSERFLPGDRAIQTPVGTQDFARVAPGNGGYLAVWEDERTVFGGFPDAESPLVGNGVDIYAARLDAAGNQVGPVIIVTQLGRNQKKPQVAWNQAAQAWLVVWVTQRPEWYFFEDIVGARIAADGTVLDTTPIPLRPESASPANDYGRNPTVASDGQNWIVAWEDQSWSGGIGRTNIAARRVSPAGSVIDAAPVVLYQHPDAVFGPIVPHVAWAGDEYLLVWERGGFYDLYGRRIAANLAPIAPEFIITTVGYGPRVASNGTDFMVVSRYAKVHRVTHAGVSLDPGGIALDVFPVNEYRGPDIAWNGSHWVVATACPRPYPSGSAIFVSRISAAGVLLGPSTAIVPGAGDQNLPSIASAGGGLSQVVWTHRNLGATQQLEDIRGTQVNASGAGGADVAVSTGWPRQQRVRFATNGDEHLAVFLSERSGVSRILAQRVTVNGAPIDAGPVEVASAVETAKIHPDVAWNGSVYLVTWCSGGTLWARRLAASGTPIDAAPVAILGDTAGSAGAGALGTDFLLVYTHTFSGDQVSLKGMVVRGEDLLPQGSAFTIGGSFVEPFPRVSVLGSRWLVSWVHRPTHDSPASAVFGAFVDAAGMPGTVFTVSGPGYGFDHGMAIGGGRAFFTWVDNAAFSDAQIQARLMNADGTFPGGEFDLCTAQRHQVATSCAWDGGAFVASWTDFRSLGEVDQLRGDIYAARVQADGTVNDPDGFQVTTGPLPEDLPSLAGAGGMTLIAYCALDGAAYPEVSRIGYRMLTMSGVTGVEAPTMPGTPSFRVGPNPFRGEVAIELSAAPDASASTQPVVEIFGVDGRRIWSGAFARSTRLAWDGRDARGRTVPAGVYFARLSAGGVELGSHRVVKVD